MLVRKKGDAVKDIFRAGGGGAAPNNLGAIMQCVWAAVDGRLPTTTGLALTFVSTVQQCHTHRSGEQPTQIASFNSFPLTLIAIAHIR